MISVAYSGQNKRTSSSLVEHLVENDCDKFARVFFKLNILYIFHY